MVIVQRKELAPVILVGRDHFVTNLVGTDNLHLVLKLQFRTTVKKEGENGKTLTSSPLSSFVINAYAFLEQETKMPDKDSNNF